MRLEGGFALLATLVSNVAGGKRTMSDFMPHADRPPEADPNHIATPEDIQRMFGVRNHG